MITFLVGHGKKTAATMLDGVPAKVLALPTTIFTQ